MLCDIACACARVYLCVFMDAYWIRSHRSMTCVVSNLTIEWTVLCISHQHHNAIDCTLHTHFHMYIWCGWAISKEMLPLSRQTNFCWLSVAHHAVKHFSSRPNRHTAYISILIFDSSSAAICVSFHRFSHHF